MTNDPRQAVHGRSRTRARSAPKWTTGRLAGMPPVQSAQALARQDTVLWALYEAWRAHGPSRACDENPLDDDWGVTATGLVDETVYHPDGRLTQGQVLAALKALKQAGLARHSPCSAHRAHKRVRGNGIGWTFTDSGRERVAAIRAAYRAARQAERDA